MSRLLDNQKMVFYTKLTRIVIEPFDQTFRNDPEGRLKQYHHLPIFRFLSYPHLQLRLIQTMSWLHHFRSAENGFLKMNAQQLKPVFSVINSGKTRTRRGFEND